MRPRLKSFDSGGGLGYGSKTQSCIDNESKSYVDTVKQLNKWYKTVNRNILKYQSPRSGLFPIDLHESEPKETHVRDSIYCATALWALSQAYKRIDNDKGRTYELGQSAVKCMRGIMACWLRQVDKLEQFKSNPCEKFALHSKFHLHTGDPIVTEDDYGHLQIDCVALYLIMLVQMINSGLQIIFTTDEVNFVQNLVFYVERAYRTPDFGMWERGSKYNNKTSELHASSIGMAKAALETINGENIFGIHGACWSVIFVATDAHNLNQIITNTILPRESSSKHIDVALLPTIGWPAFAIHDKVLVKKTMDKMTRKLRGQYGFKRHRRDGFGTACEDKSAKYYKKEEMKNFDGIENEWPLFYIYEMIKCFYDGDSERVKEIQQQLQLLLIKGSEGVIVPRYYFVPKECFAEERKDPGSQERFTNKEAQRGHLFLWGQSVYIISQLLVEGLLDKFDLDPVRRSLPASVRPRPNTRYLSFQSTPHDLITQVVLIAESVRLQQMLATYGIQTQTPRQIEPIQIWPPGELVKAYEELGYNKKLGLNGRPQRPVGCLGTSKIYRVNGCTFVCYSLLYEVSDFYLSSDMNFLVEELKSELRFLSKCWKLAGRPTYSIILREDNLRGNQSKKLFEVLSQIKRGDVGGCKVKLGRLQEFVSSSNIDHLDFMKTTNKNFDAFEEKNIGKKVRSLSTSIEKIILSNNSSTWVYYEDLLKKSNNELSELYNETENYFCKAQILQALLNREGLYFNFLDSNVEEKLEDLLKIVTFVQIWPIIRFCTSLLNKNVNSLAPSITSILVRGKQVTLGVFGHEEVVIDKPISPQEVKRLLYQICFSHDVCQAVLQQEIIIDIGKLISTEPQLFDGILTLRIGWLVQAMILELSFARDGDIAINEMPPSEIKNLLRQVMKSNTSGSHRSVIWNRQLDGALNRVPPKFYDKIWSILERTPGGIKVAGYLIPQQPTLSDMTEYELNFSLLVEQMLSKILDPAYRQMIVETVIVVFTILERNAEMSFQQPVNFDKIITEAFSLFQKDKNDRTGEEKTDDMTAFFNTPPNVKNGTTSYIAKSVVNTLLDGSIDMTSSDCCVS